MLQDLDSAVLNPHTHNTHLSVSVLGKGEVCECIHSELPKSSFQIENACAVLALSQSHLTGGSVGLRKKKERKEDGKREKEERALCMGDK